MLISCLLFGLSLAVGQMLFKLTANSIVSRLDFSLFHALLSPWLFAALCLYAGTTALWVFILTRLPLTVAYPFSLLGSALVPVLAFAFLGEQMPLKSIFGLFLVLAGLSVMYR